MQRLQVPDSADVGHLKIVLQPQLLPLLPVNLHTEAIGKQKGQPIRSVMHTVCLRHNLKVPEDQIAALQPHYLAKEVNVEAVFVDHAHSTARVSLQIGGDDERLIRQLLVHGNVWFVYQYCHFLVVKANGQNEAEPGHHVVQLVLSILANLAKIHFNCQVSDQ